MASPLQNGNPFGMPLSQVQPNYVYVPSSAVTLSQPLGDAATSFLMEHQEMSKNVVGGINMGVPKLPSSDVQSQQHDMHLASLELSGIQPSSAVVTNQMISDSRCQNFPLVHVAADHQSSNSILPPEDLGSFEENVDKTYEGDEMIEGKALETLKTENDLTR